MTMRWAIVALAVLTAGCAALPPEVVIRFPNWMRGQGVNSAQTSAPAPTPATTPAAASVAALSFPTGDFPAVHTAFTAEVTRRYGQGMSQNAVVADVQGQGFRCTPDNLGQQVCERAQPIGGGCEDIFVVTARPGSSAVGDVRRRCPIGQTPPTQRPTNLLGAPVGF